MDIRKISVGPDYKSGAMALPCWSTGSLWQLYYTFIKIQCRRKRLSNLYRRFY